MTAPGNSVVLVLLLAAFLACTGYAGGRLHQWYRMGQERDEAYRDGYDTATRSVFSMAARIISPRRTDRSAIRASAAVVIPASAVVETATSPLPPTAPPPGASWSPQWTEAAPAISASHVPAPRPAREGSGPRSADVPGADVLRAELPRAGVPREEAPHVDVPGVGVPGVGVPLVDVPGVGVPRIGVPLVDVPGVGVPRVDVPRVAVSRVDTSRVDVPRVDVPRADSSAPWEVLPDDPTRPLTFRSSPGPRPARTRHDAAAEPAVVGEPVALEDCPEMSAGGRRQTPDAETSGGRHMVPDELVQAPTYRLPPDRVARAKVRGASTPSEFPADPTPWLPPVPKPRSTHSP
jgi:hypothetical protein